MSASRSIVVRLRAEVADFKRSLGEASSALGDLDKRAQNAISRNEQSINTLSNTAGAVGLAMVAAGGAAVKAFADFDEAMSAVQAATHESAENMDLLRDAALDAGARTKFSATEAAGAVEELAKAGVSTADILGGGLDGALDLAAAGAMDVAGAAELMSSTLAQFNKTGDQASHIADLLAAGAGKAQGEVADMGQALNQAGLVANQMGLSVEETTGTLAAFAKAGLIGSDAGTSFRAMLLRLANPTKESADLMAELGINAYDAQGQFVGMESLAGQLATQMGDLDQETRNAALAQIFGMDAIRSASILYEQGADGIAEWTDAVDDSGYAAETAALRMDNLKGDVEQLTGSLETAFIGMGEAADGPLRKLVQSATDVVNAFSSAPDAVQGTLMAIVGGGGLVLLGLAGMGKLVVGINDARNAMKDLGLSAKTAGTLIGVASAALAVAAIGVTAWVEETARADAMADRLAGTLSETAEVTDDTRAAIRDLMAETRSFSFLKFDSVYDEAEKMGISFETLTEYVLGNADAIDEVNAKADEFVAGSSPWEHVIQSRQGAVQNLTYSLDTMAGSLTEAEKAELQKIQADKEAGVASEDLAAATDVTTDAIEEQTDALADMISKLEEASGVVKSQMEAEADLQAAIDDATAAIEENGATLDITTEKGRANQDALFGIRDAGFEVIAAMRENGASQGELQAQMAASRQAFIDTATEMGLTAEEAGALADELGLIPTEIRTDVTVSTGEADRQARAFWESWAGKEIPMNVVVRGAGDPGSQRRAATGGLITGPGTGTSDSIPARLSNGEYVIKAAAVARYGVGMFHDLNAMRFASGGYVGGGTAPAAPAAPFPDTVRLDAASVQAVAEAIVAGAERVSSGVVLAHDRRESSMQHTKGATW